MILIARLIDLYSLVVFAAVILSWIPTARDNAIARLIESATEPVFARIRAVLPPMGGLDLSPMIVLIALRLLRGFLY